jgi:catechol 2,3-dioxygenase-like lactoylglutathione lyase family enzyme
MTTPIKGLHHVEISVSGFDQAVGDFEALFGIQARPAAGAGVAFDLGNVTLLVRANTVSGSLGLVCFEVDKPERMARRLQHLGIGTERDDDPTQPGRVRLNRSQTYAVPLGYALEPRPPAAPGARDTEILGLDHLVLGTRQPDRAAALYGARLGLDMRTDITRAEWGVRLMFFRCGDLIVEIAQNLREDVQIADDQFYGFSWRTRDIDKTHARLTQQGFNLSAIRTGRRPGTRIFTVRDRTAGIPTVILEPPKQASAANPLQPS